MINKHCPEPLQARTSTRHRYYKSIKQNKFIIYNPIQNSIRISSFEDTMRSSNFNTEYNGEVSENGAHVYQLELLLLLRALTLLHVRN